MKIHARRKRVHSSLKIPKFDKLHCGLNLAKLEGKSMPAFVAASFSFPLSYFERIERYTDRGALSIFSQSYINTIWGVRDELRTMLVLSTFHLSGISWTNQVKYSLV